MLAVGAGSVAVFALLLVLVLLFVVR
jgi:hypothetical protein